MKPLRDAGYTHFKFGRIAGTPFIAADRANFEI